MTLSWVRLETGFPDNPKVLALVGRKQYRAAFVYACSLAWSGRHETDGHIPRAALPFMHATKVDAKALVEAALWGVTDDGWVIPDFAEYQITNVSAADRANAAKYAACQRWHSQPCSKCAPPDPEAN